MKRAYDAVVVGAGPAGSVAARRLAEGGLDVLLIEKRQEIGAPVRCAEAVGAYMTSEHIPISDRWINARISHYAVKNAEGDAVIVPPTEPTLIVDRKVFDWELAHLAVRSGAEVRTRTQAEGLIRDEDGRLIGVRISSVGKSAIVHTRLVIAADGTESQVARWAGLKTVPPMGDFYVGFQYLLGNVGGRIEPTLCEYHLGHSMAPGGYVWVFPKGDDTANVGLVISADRAADIPAQEYLDRFVARLFPGASILGIVAGGIPATGALKKMVADGVMAVGDAAHQADPLTAGGINLAMVGAAMAAQVALKAFQTGDFSAQALSEYEGLWRAQFGRMHAALYQVRKLLSRMDDERINHLIRTASTLPLETMTLGDVMLALFRHHPRLLIQAQVLIATGLILK
jgi:digeranylgeranylglycerophospholipid reductase